MMEKRRLDTVLFDLGGTLIYFDGNFDEIIAKSVLHLADQLSEDGYVFHRDNFISDFDDRMKVYYTERANDHVEYTTEYLLLTLLQEYGFESPSSRDLQQALKAMYAVSEAYWYVESDTSLMLEKLHDMGYHLGLVSNAADEANVQRLIDKANIRCYFDIILISAAVGIRKPDPKIFRMALEQWHVEPSSAVMVGDTYEADIVGAHNLGLSTIWITRRIDKRHYQNQSLPLKPDIEIDNLSVIPNILTDWNS